jgi:3-methyladenine DNA glycosylase AlkC
LIVKKRNITQITIQEYKIQLALGTLDYDARISLALNKATPKGILKMLAVDSEIWIREYVANNSNANTIIFTILSRDSSVYVRRAVAKNPIVQAEVLEILSKDKDRHVRAWVARNLNTSIKILNILLSDKSKDVADAAKSSSQLRNRMKKNLKKVKSKKYAIRIK